jgi:hypothetical protein
MGGQVLNLRPSLEARPYVKKVNLSKAAIVSSVTALATVARAVGFSDTEITKAFARFAVQDHTGPISDMPLKLLWIDIAREVSAALGQVQHCCWMLCKKIFCCSNLEPFCMSYQFSTIHVSSTENSHHVVDKHLAGNYVADICVVTNYDTCVQTVWCACLAVVNSNLKAG